MYIFLLGENTRRVAMSTRTVELFRGSRGYGFTLSGQGPCVLSNIVPESPADLAGLVIGDRVLEANGRNVSMLGHDEVVKWIAGSGHSGSSLTILIGVPENGKSQFPSQLKYSEASTIRPPPFPSFAIQGKDIQNHQFIDSSSDDEFTRKNGYRERNIAKHNHNPQTRRDGHLHQVRSFSPPIVHDKGNDFIVSDDECHNPRATEPKSHRDQVDDIINEGRDVGERDFQHTDHQVWNPKMALSNLNDTCLPKNPSSFPKPIHIRGHSEDSTLTDGSNWFPSPAAIASRRPKRHSPKKKTTRLSQEKYIPRPKYPSPLKKVNSPQATHCQLGGSEELQLLTESEISTFLHPTLDELRKSLKLQRDKNPSNIDLSKVVLKVVVGYLGTIEMPKQETPSSRDVENDSTPTISLQAIRNCIRRLRVEKKVHTTVLMCIFPENVILLNHHGVKLAEYPAHQITYCGTCTDDKRFLGLVTTRKLLKNEFFESEEDEEGTRGSSTESSRDMFSSSCHVFMTESTTNADESELLRRAKAFQFEPTKMQHSMSGDVHFIEFPLTVEPIAQTIMSIYSRSTEFYGNPQMDLEKDEGNGENHRMPLPQQISASGVASNVSPGQHSNTSGSLHSGTTRTSNSDSGIGFKDDGNGISANVIQAIAQVNREETNEEDEIRRSSDQSLKAGNEENTDNYHVPPIPIDDVVSERRRTSSIETEHEPRCVQENGNAGEESFNTEKLESQNSAENIRQSMQRYLHNKNQHLRKESEKLSSVETVSDNSRSSFHVPREEIHSGVRSSSGLPLYQSNSGLPPYQNPPNYPSVASANDLTQNRVTNTIEEAIPLTMSPQKYKQRIFSNDEMLESRGMASKKDFDYLTRNRVESIEGDNSSINTDMDRRDAHSGYSCSASSSLSREFSEQKQELKNLNVNHNQENVNSFKSLRKDKLVDKFLLPNSSCRSDSNLSQMIGEVETCVSIPTTSPGIISSSNQHQFFLHNSRSKLPDPQLLLSNTTNSKG